MTQHLSAEDMSRWMIGERSSERARHVRECGECREQLELMETTLGQFRSSVREWSDRTGCPAPVVQRRSIQHAGLRWLWAAAVTACLLTGVSVTWTSRAHQRAAERATADALLLEQVDSGISRAVPGPMEALVPMVSWSTGPTTSDQNNGNQ